MFSWKNLEILYPLFISLSLHPKVYQIIIVGKVMAWAIEEPVS
jgi:hypothetical protein